MQRESYRKSTEPYLKEQSSETATDFEEQNITDVGTSMESWINYPLYSTVYKEKQNVIIQYSLQAWCTVF